MKRLIPTRRGPRRQRGLALATVIFLMVVLALLAGAILYAAQLDTLTSNSYAATTRAGYIADAGLQQALNWFQHNYCSASHVPACAGLQEPVGDYDNTKTPVAWTVNEQPVVLDASGGSSNYPDPGTVTSFQNTLQNVSIGSGQGAIAVKATLISDTVEHTIEGTQSLERWEVQVTGSWTENGVTLAQTEVVGFIEEGITPITNYAMFSTGQTCGSITMQGNSYTDSYDSSLGYEESVSSTTGGDIGSYGNIQASGAASIGGNAYVPGGVRGSCSAGNPVGFTQSGGNVSVDGQIESMTSPCLTCFPPPPMVSNCMASNDCLPMPSPDISGNITLQPTCTQGNDGTTTCSTASIGYGNLAPSGGTIYLPAGSSTTANVYYINSMQASGTTNLSISGTGEVIINLVGYGTLPNVTNCQSCVFELSGGVVVNPSLVPSNLQINYAGTGNMLIDTGDTTASMVIYAPQAGIYLSGNSGIYGSLLAKSIAEGGAAGVHYDRRLKNTTLVLDPFQLVSWNRQVQ